MNKKLPAKKFKKPSLANTAIKGSIGFILLILLIGYQPTFSIPPLKTNLAHASENSQTFKIDPQSLPLGFQHPHPGYLSTKYSRFHPGVDIATGLGMPIKPISPGKVTKAGFDIWGFGLMVEIDHGHGYKSVYAHMGRIFVKKDQAVKETEFLGEVGMTGFTSGPHTHLEVFKDSKTIDPVAILPPLRLEPVAGDFEATGSAALKVSPKKI